jgi:two-component system KDP operon response regulator KdpE
MTPSGAVTVAMSSRPAKFPAATDIYSSSARDRPRILLCDTESQSLHALRVVLRGAGFEVDVTRSAADALDRSALRLPTASIIELVLPDGDGVEVCRRLREWSAMPVMMLSAVLDEDEQVRALEAGADDYVTKPFRPRELVARLLAHLRRADPGSEEPSLNLDGLVIDRAARAVSRDGDEIHLTPIEFKLLSVLLQNPGRLLTHNALLQHVWGPGYIDAKQTLRGHMANLRRKIEPVDGGHLIRTHHGAGYILASTPRQNAGQVQPVEAIDTELARSALLGSHPREAAVWLAQAS